MVAVFTSTTGSTIQRGVGRVEWVFEVLEAVLEASLEVMLEATLLEAPEGALEGALELQHMLKWRVCHPGRRERAIYCDFAKTSIFERFAWSWGHLYGFSGV